MVSSTPLPSAVILDVPSMVWRTFSPHAFSHCYDRDHAVFSHGDAAQALWIVVDGWVKLSRHTPNGQETITGLCTKGDLFGEATLFAHANYPYTATVLSDSTRLACVAGDAVRKLVKERRDLSDAIMTLLSERAEQAQLQLEHRSTLSAAQRLGCFLLRLAGDQNKSPITLNIPVEKHILATYLGMKAETLSRSQQQLRPLGVSVQGHKLTISMPEKLRDFVCNSCSEMGSCQTDSSGYYPTTT